jgi:enoyl-CoA hydratase
MAQDLLEADRGGGVVLLTLDRPEARNALGLALRQSLAEAFGRMAGDDAVRCVVLTGGPDVFAAGADIKAMATQSANEAAARSTAPLWKRLKEFPKPVIAAVNGYALGGGCELAMHCDIIVAGRGARFGQPEVRVGIMPGAGGTQRLVRAVGKFKAMRMLMTGEPVTAEEAEHSGLVSEVVDDDKVLERALALAGTIAALPAKALRQIKQLVLEGPDLPLDAALLLESRSMQLLFGTPDQREGMAAFIEKRKPVFE